VLQNSLFSPLRVKQNPRFASKDGKVALVLEFTRYKILLRNSHSNKSTDS